ncbi:unnamed protein product [Cuscuta epithymum]|uniref:Uncharacterized protein n=1 Tax=Cuscuta epithymum TaxID=186058 RepID=A0AAV0E7F6_9ASTE|nr:unnamed protein product [Cuscuta epithymum]
MISRANKWMPFNLGSFFVCSQKMQDRFSFLINHCIPTPSQEEKLRTCSFARQSEVFPGLSGSNSSSPAPTSPELTPITMVSLPENGSDEEIPFSENEGFETLPEQGNSMSQPYLFGSEEVRPPTASAALCSQSDSPWDKRAPDSDEEGIEHQTTVDLGKESDDLGFLEPLDVNCELYAPEGSHCAKGSHKSGFRVCNFEDGDNDEYPSKRVRVSGEYLGVGSSTLSVFETQPSAAEVRDDDTVDADLVRKEAGNGGTYDKVEKGKGKCSIEGGHNLPCSVNGGEKLVRLGEKTVGGNLMNKDNDTHDNVEKGKVKCSTEGGRKLPFSVKGGEKFVRLGEETVRGNLMNEPSSSPKDLMEVLEMLLEKVDGEGKEGNGAGLLETAISRGWDFPKPRWWPPEGFDD